MIPDHKNEKVIDNLKSRDFYIEKIKDEIGSINVKNDLKDYKKIKLSNSFNNLPGLNNNVCKS